MMRRKKIKTVWVRAKATWSTSDIIRLEGDGFDCLVPRWLIENDRKIPGEKDKLYVINTKFMSLHKLKTLDPKEVQRLLNPDTVA